MEEGERRVGEDDYTGRSVSFTACFSMHVWMYLSRSPCRHDLIYSQVKQETRVEANKASVCSRFRRVFDMWCYEQNKHRASPPVWVCYPSSSESDQVLSLTQTVGMTVSQLAPALGNRECTQANIQLSGVQSYEKALWRLATE